MAAEEDVESLPLATYWSNALLGIHRTHEARDSHVPESVEGISISLEKGLEYVRKPKNWLEHPIFRVLVEGRYDVDSSLYGLPIGVLEVLFKKLTEMWYHDFDHGKAGLLMHFNTSKVFSSSVSFPEPRDLNINMMPVDLKMDEDIPYRRLCRTTPLCSEICSNENTIGYLTVQEGLVEAGESQRRPGIHVESPGFVEIGSGEATLKRIELDWGAGTLVEAFPENGIYMASNVEDSCRVWNCQLKRDAFVGALGDISHLRMFLTEENGVLIPANWLYWITDKTPHESVLLKETYYRQYFRLVSPQITAWYANHSTPPTDWDNMPGSNVIILKGDKFCDHLEEIDQDQYKFEYVTLPSILVTKDTREFTRELTKYGIKRNGDEFASICAVLDGNSVNRVPMVLRKMSIMLLGFDAENPGVRWEAETVDANIPEEYKMRLLAKKPTWKKFLE